MPTMKKMSPETNVMMRTNIVHGLNIFAPHVSKKFKRLLIHPKEKRIKDKTQCNTCGKTTQIIRIRKC